MACVTASGQSLKIVGQVKVVLKIHGFSWSWVLLVSRRLRGQPNLGADFISATKMMLELTAPDAFLFLLRQCILSPFGVITICLVHRLCPFLLGYPKCNRGTFTFSARKNGAINQPVS
jgi:hypothetical protein